ncbi:adenine specific DNA methylase Mod [Mycolicibacterium rhodesiae NBB3]|uniref:Adenine specific DNA methylase Mod n=1 Tax=Mycolicibacterium rhodesiae (strain NBB3) TaxID=710685 RepID=G8RRT8_MYCRN|nr:site-specific DNA-methyltransferase [Mycolicibacterium rhodesiae]AEV71529.1 adenine specific DNA methylase Mod [Mycolicibacterium rhodesiae NBB3]
MARKTSNGPTPVESITHDEKRTNIPTADNVDFHDSSILDEVRQVRYARDESLDPQLVWRGKYPYVDEVDGFESNLVSDAPPIYIQEKIDPRVLVENLRRTAERPENEPEFTLFDSFDGLDDLQQIEFYQHEANWSNRMILGDSLQVMSSLAEREKLRGKVQMIYIDPPYGIKFGSNWQVSTRDRDVKDGKRESAAREVEQIKAFRDTWELGIHSYLSYLRDRLISARELLTDSGSCFVQIGDENVHLVRSLLDEVFGSDNFCALINYKTTTGAGSPGITTEVLAGVSDYLVWYARDRSNLKYRTLYFERDVQGDANYRYVNENGRIRPLSSDELRDVDSLYRRGVRVLRQNPLTSQTAGATTTFPVEIDGVTYRPNKGGWKTNAVGMEKLRHAGRLMPSGKTLGFVRYFADFPYQIYSNAWDDTRQSGFGDAKTYVVQTAAKVIERCMLLTTDPGDLVLDPTCGSGTTAAVAEQWGRRWITIDTSRVALALARQRVMGARFPWYLLVDSEEGNRKEQSLTALPLPRRNFSGNMREGFVYDRALHITLKSIANNPEITAGMGQQDIDDAIRRYADFELLYDKPFEDSKKVRVAGPFTVESLSPHRALSFSDWDESNSEAEAAKDADSPSFEQSILSNLSKAGVQNGTRSERITFTAFETYAGSYIQAIGEQIETGAHAKPTRVGIAVGPQYGTVSATYVKNAAKEAIQAGDINLLCILGFAFDPNVTNVTETDGVTVEATDEGFAQVEGARLLGKLPVLMVRMNADLLMGEELKKTGAGNLFTVFGEPDIEITKTKEGYVVDLRGVDVYDPTTGEVRSNDTGQIALWMIDTDYNGESFFVRHCYFTGGNDPYKRLKTALKADIDEEAWNSLYQTVSRPFPEPSEGNKVAVKVINDYGDEVMKVFEV